MNRFTGLALALLVGGLPATALPAKSEAPACVQLVEFEKQLGVQVVDGILVADVRPGSIAEQADLRNGDLIAGTGSVHSFRKVGGIQDFIGKIREEALWNRADLTVYRKLERHQVTLQLRNPDERLGFAGGRAVLITGVLPNSVATKVGIRPGVFLLEVNAAPVGNMTNSVDLDAKVTDALEHRADSVLKVGTLTVEQDGGHRWDMTTIALDAGPLDGPNPPPGMDEPGPVKNKDLIHR